MLRIARRSALAAIAAFGLLFAAPLAAEARGDHRGRQGYEHRGFKDHGHEGHGHYRGRGHHDDRGRRARHHHRGNRGHREVYAPRRGHYDYGRSYAPRYRHEVVVHSPFYCGPCGHGFSHRRHFDSHLVVLHHGIAVHAISSVIVHTLRGLLYYGY